MWDGAGGVSVLRVPRRWIIDLLSGESCGEVVTYFEPPEIGALVEIRPTDNKRRSICRGTVAETWPTRRGGTVVRFEDDSIEWMPVVVGDRYLARQNGRYFPAQYQSTPVGAVDDVPAVPDEWEDDFALAAAQGRVLQLAELRKAWEEDSIITRLEAEIMEAERLGIDPGREMARLEAGLAALKRRNALEKQQRRKAA